MSDQDQDRAAAIQCVCTDDDLYSHIDCPVHAPPRCTCVAGGRRCDTCRHDDEVERALTAPGDDGVLCTVTCFGRRVAIRRPPPPDHEGDVLAWVQRVCAAAERMEAAEEVKEDTDDKDVGGTK